MHIHHMKPQSADMRRCTIASVTFVEFFTLRFYLWRKAVFLKTFVKGSGPTYTTDMGNDTLLILRCDCVLNDVQALVVNITIINTGS